MDGYILFTNKNTKPVTVTQEEKGGVTDIIDMSQNISGDWLNKIAEKKIIIQEQIQEQKDKKQHSRRED